MQQCFEAELKKSKEAVPSTFLLLSLSGTNMHLGLMTLDCGGNNISTVTSLI